MRPLADGRPGPFTAEISHYAGANQRCRVSSATLGNAARVAGKTSRKWRRESNTPAAGDEIAASVHRSWAQIGM